MAAGRLFELIRCVLAFFFFFRLHGNIEDTGVGLEARTGKLNWSLKMGQSALIAANGTEWLINIMSLLISFTLRKKRSACICWFGSTDFTLGGGKKKAFICPVAEPECYRLVQEKKEPQVMVHYLNGTFPLLFLGNGQLIHPSDLTLGDCVTQQTSNHILGFQTPLQGCNSVLKVCFFLSFLPSALSKI